eukprot:CAMPEP_0168509270 /NCGR_PEP_ID=MMETSP0405-20121227/667_1 /TAXON_ID=498012 /ORGANISM="Trichosphaerium sp, Strain Am-I-7 wt" /LENGTH=142 /DNA_ID=CAMNT_0008526679 /DNA_START=332 /DNA_END=757 /DNA_ORIENTATION=+
MNDKIFIPEFKFGSPQMNFYHRFSAFYTLPHPPSEAWHKFKQQGTNFKSFKLQDVFRGSLDSYKLALEGFNELNSHADTPDALKNTIKRVKLVAHTNYTGLSKLPHNKQLKDDTLTAKFSFDGHPHWPVITLVKKQAKQPVY